MAQETIRKYLENLMSQGRKKEVEEYLEAAKARVELCNTNAHFKPRLAPAQERLAVAEEVLGIKAVAKNKKD